MNDGNAIRLTFPELNEARRKELAKEVSKLGEDTKVQIRNIRRDAIDDVKKEQKELNTSEDEVRSLEEKIQKITDKQIEVVSVVVSEKEKEIMEI
jgi:ribosome recycling factor